MDAPEKRREKRYRRRLHVVFEASGTKVGGYTTNLSARGMLVASSLVFPPGTIVKGHIEIPDGSKIAIDARVRWAVRVHGTFAVQHERSMGLEILGPIPAELMGLLEGAREELGRAPLGGIARSRAPTPPVPAPAIRPRPASSGSPGVPPIAPMQPPVPQMPVPQMPASPPRPPPPPTPAPAVPGTSLGRPPITGTLVPGPGTPVPQPADQAPLTPAPPPPAPALRPVPASPAPRVGQPTPPASHTSGLTPGLEGTAFLKVPDPRSITPAMVAALVDQATDDAIGGRVSPDLQGHGVSLSLAIVDTEPVRAGSMVQALARVNQITGNGRVVEVTVEISERGRPLATATLTRMLVKRR